MSINHEMSITYSATYDNSYETLQYTMYDKFPYERNTDLCNEEHIKTFSGNIIKGYRCKIDIPYEVNSNH